MLRTQNLNFKYSKGPLAIKDFSIHIPSGFVGILGDNGAGKSTLFKLMLGFLAPSSGSLNLWGQPVNHLMRSRIGFMPEREASLPGLHSLATLRLLAELSGVPPRLAFRRAHEMLAFVGLRSQWQTDPATFSLGMKQRFKLAVALIHGPELLLLDEPTSGLDPDSRNQFFSLLQQCSSQGVSILLSTHILTDLEREGINTLLVMSQGESVYCGSFSPEQLQQEGHYLIHAWPGQPKFLALLQEKGIEIVKMEGQHAHVYGKDLNPKFIFDLAKENKIPLRRLEPFVPRLHQWLADLQIKEASV